ncbi:hypothetical protein K0A97_02770 [Patescibacteria group bacterium]|nr:hypothetical protein [Patescibacteria group bacterium]
MGPQNRKHRKDLEKIASSPEKFGFPVKNIISVSIEENLFHKGKLRAQPDIIILERKGENKLVHIIEYKSNGNGELLQRAQKQLQNAVAWFGRYRPDIDLEDIYTYIISGSDQKYKGLFN